eukprot:COSAG02_NODE_33998_length_491_cov_0.778061_1_plen_163_part_11
MRSPRRAAGPGGLSAELRACMPYIKFLWVALEELPQKFHHVGRVQRGIKWAFPEPANHDPENFFYPGREFCWYEFKSSSTDFNVMYDSYFCGDRGPRTIFTIQGVKCYQIKIFSALQREEEALFPPLSEFHVVSSQKKLRPQDLCHGSPAGGFPDEVQMIAPP